MKKAFFQIGVTAFLPYVIRRVFEPLASKSVAARFAQSPKVRSLVTPSDAAVLPVASIELSHAAERPGDQATVPGLQKQKNRAWAAFYTAPSSCEHPAAWHDQVECGNRYMRAKTSFEQQWAAAHSSDQVSEPFVLDKAAIRQSRTATPSRPGGQ